MSKPDPRIYALSCERLAAEPARTLFLDDHAPNVEAARQCGLRAVLYPDNAQAISDMEDLLGGKSTS